MRHVHLLAWITALGAACGESSPLATGDAAPLDAADDAAAPVDAGVDAPIDARPDAATDAAIDAGTTALVIPIIDLGHVTSVQLRGLSADRALTVDIDSHWLLWDRAARTVLARGDSPPCTQNPPCGSRTDAALAGDTMIAWSPLRLEFRAAATADLVSALDINLFFAGVITGRVGVAVDGSYVYATTHTGVQTWTPAGAPIVAVPGAYGNTVAYAGPGQLQLVRTFAHEVERVALPAGTVTTVPFQGSFQGWFTDGGHFWTRADPPVGSPPVYQLRIYARDGALVSNTTVDLGTLVVGGHGDRVAVRDPSALRIHDVTDVVTPITSIPVASGATVVLARDRLGIAANRTLREVVLGAPIVQGPMIALSHTLTAYAADGAGWFGGAGSVVLAGAGVDASPALNLGGPIGTATSPGLAAVSTESGTTLLLGGAVPAVTGTLPLAPSRMALTADGATLLSIDTRANDASTRLRATAVATGATVRLWPYDAPGGERLIDVALAPVSGRMSHLVFRPGVPLAQSRARRLFRLDGEALPDYGPPVAYLGSKTYGQHLYSPTGRGAAAQLPENQDFHLDARVELYRDGALFATVDGIALGWLDDNRVFVVDHYLLANQVRTIHRIHYLDGTPALELSGLFVDTPVIAVGQDQLYAPAYNVVVDVPTSTISWTGPPPHHVTAPLGDFILEVEGARLVADQFRP